MTGYVLLALMLEGSREDLIQGSSIARWLTLQRNAYGGFKSTQVRLTKHSSLLFRRRHGSGEIPLVSLITILGHIPNLFDGREGVTRNGSSTGKCVTMLIFWQDTVVALQALTVYAAETYVEDMDVSVRLRGTSLERVTQVNSTNRMLVQRVRDVMLPNELRFVVSGRGCVMLQVSVHRTPHLLRRLSLLYLQHSMQTADF